MEDLFWDKYKTGMNLLKRDIEYSHIREKDKKEIIDFAWRTGMEAAERIQKRYPFCLPSRIAEKEQIILTETDAVNSWNYSEFLPSKKEILLYKNKIMLDSPSEGMRSGKYEEYRERRELFIAHEIFHYLEYTDTAVKHFRRQYPVTVLDLKILRVTRELTSMSEIGAYAFTRKFFGIGDETEEDN